MTEAQFIREIQNEMTGSGSLPIVLEEVEIKRLIEQSARWFYLNWQYAVESQHYVIQKSAFNNEIFKRTREIILPDCVIGVYRFQEINGVGRLGNIDRDFAEDRLIASEIFLSSFHGDDLVMRTAQYQAFDLYKAYFLEQISYDFNHNTKRLKVLGRDPKFDVYIEASVKIPLDRLFDDYYFLRYVTGKAKLTLSRILGMYPFPLPGKVTIDTSILRDEGNEDISWVLERIDQETTPDWNAVITSSVVAKTVPSPCIFRRILVI